jgi:hypothetical protein
MIFGLFNMILTVTKRSKKNKKVKTLLLQLIAMFLYIYITGMLGNSIDEKVHQKKGPYLIGYLDSIIAMLILIGTILFIIVSLILWADLFKSNILIVVVLLLTITYICNCHICYLEDDPSLDKRSFSVTTTGTTIVNAFNKVATTATNAVGIYASISAGTAMAKYMMANPKGPRAPGYVGMAIAGTLGMGSTYLALRGRVEGEKLMLQAKGKNKSVELVENVTNCENKMDHIKCPLEEFEINNDSISHIFTFYENGISIIIFAIVTLSLIYLLIYFSRKVAPIKSIALKQLFNDLKKKLIFRSSYLTLSAVPFLKSEFHLTPEERFSLMLFSMRCFISIGLYVTFCLVIIHFMSTTNLVLSVKFFDKLIKKIYNRFNNNKLILYVLLLVSQLILMYQVLIIMPSFI